MKISESVTEKCGYVEGTQRQKQDNQEKTRWRKRLHIWKHCAASTEQTVSCDGTTMLLLSFVPRTGDIHHVGDIVELHKAPLEKGEKSRDPSGRDSLLSS